MEIVGREPEVSVRVLAHGDEAVVRQRREITRCRTEVLERITVEAADPVPGADPHESARIGIDVRNAVVRQAVERGVGLEDALRRLLGGRFGRPAKQDQKGQQQAFHEFGRFR